MFKISKDTCELKESGLNAGDIGDFVDYNASSIARAHLSMVCTGTVCMCKYVLCLSSLCLCCACTAR